MIFISTGRSAAAVVAVTALASALVLAGGGSAAAASCGQAVHVYVSPRDTNPPFGISAGPGGTWYARGSRMDLIPAAGGPIQQYPVDPAAGLGWVTSPRSGAGVVWFAERGTGRIGYLTTSVGPRQFQIPDGAAGPAVPQALVLGGGQVFFTDQANDRIGRFDEATRQFTFWSVPTGDPLGMVRGPDNDLYFTERAVDKVGRLDPRTGLFTEWTLAPGAFPNRLAVTPDGNVWFTELNTDMLGYVDRTGHLHELPLAGGAVGLTYYHGYLYAALFGAGELAQIDLTGAVTRTWALPRARGVLQVTQSQGYLWVADGFGNRVYRVNETCT